MTPYEKLRGKINILIPSRLVLGFGCEIAFHENDIYKIICENVEKNGWHLLGAGDVRPIITKDILHHAKYIEILGAPLTMADVLRAIGKAEGNRVYIDEPSGFDESEAKLFLDDADRTVLGLDLSKPVSEWPEETLDAIIGLLEN